MKQERNLSETTMVDTNNNPELTVIKRPPNLKRLRNRVKSFLSATSLIVPLYYIFAPQYRSRLVTSKTEIVIEGFPRSANTFAYFAFLKAQERDVKVAHHIHLAAQIVEGVRRKIPVLILIRRPEDAVKSLCVRHPSASQHRAFRKWLQFYEVVENHRDHIVIGEFQQVTSRFGEVIRRINQKFSTSYALFESNPHATLSVFEKIEEFNQSCGENNPLQVNRPSLQRESIYKNLEIQQGELLDRANELYTHLTDGQ
jgi:hypothetical protein